MRVCAYWDCARQIGETESFCFEHGPKLNQGLIDPCPKCGRYKDNRYKLCHDCQYGRPIADWKIIHRNLENVEYIEIKQPEKPEIIAEKAESIYQEPERTGPQHEINTVTYSRGEAECPRCGSTDLEYKSVFDYFRCNDCNSTFITPVFSYDKVEGKKGTAIESTKELTRQIFGETQPNVYEKRLPARQVFAEPQADIYEERLPARQIFVETQANVYEERLPVQQVFSGAQLERQHERDDFLSGAGIIDKRKPTNTGWLILSLLFCIIIITAVAVWIFFGNPIEDILGGLLNGIAFI